MRTNNFNPDRNQNTIIWNKQAKTQNPITIISINYNQMLLRCYYFFTYSLTMNEYANQNVLNLLHFIDEMCYNL